MFDKKQRDSLVCRESVICYGLCAFLSVIFINRSIENFKMLGIKIELIYLASMYNRLRKL